MEGLVAPLGSLGQGRPVPMGHGACLLPPNTCCAPEPLKAWAELIGL